MLVTTGAGEAHRGQNEQGDTQGTICVFTDRKPGASRGSSLMRLKLGRKYEAPIALADGLRRGFEVSANGKMLLLRVGSGLHVVPASARKPIGKKALSNAKLDLSSWRLRISPREEWTQIFEDSLPWYFQFYDHAIKWLLLERWQRA